VNILEARAKRLEQTIDFHSALGGGLDNEPEDKLSELMTDLFHLMVDKDLPVWDLLKQAARSSAEEQLDEYLAEEEIGNEPAILTIEAGRICGDDDDSVFVLEGKETLRGKLTADFQDNGVEIISVFSEELFELINRR